MGNIEGGVIEIIKWIRESVRPVYVIFVLSGICLLPHSWLDAIGMAEWTSAHHPVTVLFFLGSIIWLSSFPIEKQYRLRESKGHLDRLASDEKDAFKPYIQNNKTTHCFIWNTIPTAKNLAKLGFLHEVATGDGRASQYFTIDSWTFSYLQEHPELIGLPKI